METEARRKSERLVSLDALRGFDMFWITGGTSFVGKFCLWTGIPILATVESQFHHTEWNGFTFLDLIFPLFMFMVGTSLPFAMSRRIEQGANKKKLFLHVLRRAATIVFLGLLANGILNFDFENLRYAGVLQRIGLGYLFASCIILLFGLRGQIISFVTLLLGYWAIMMWVPVPGIGAGILTPEGNFASYIDRQFLPGSFCCFDLGDNEGLLSTLPAICSSLLGVFAGHWLRSENHSKTKRGVGLLIAGIASLIIALVWNPFFPINKLLWSSSYVLFAGGWSLLLLGSFYLVIDAWGCKMWAFPFVVIGMNALTIYIGQELIDFHHTSEFFFEGIAGFMGGFGPVFLAFAVVLLKWLFLYFLYCKKIFLKA